MTDASEPVTDADFEALTVDWDAVPEARQLEPLAAPAAWGSLMSVSGD